MFKTYSFDTHQTGPHVLILGAVHGNETAGSQALHEIIRQIQNKELSLLKGSVTFIPVVNEKAKALDARFADENLNRVIKFHPNPITNEQKIANLLIKEIEKADVLLDLHSTHCPEDEAFAFIDYPTEKNLQFLKIIPVKTALAGWPLIYKNNPEIDNFCTEEYAYQHGVSALTLECGYHKSPQAIQLAQTAILNTLSFFNGLNEFSFKENEKRLITLDTFIIKDAEGDFIKEVNHLTPLKKGEIIARYHNNKEIIMPYDGLIIMPNKNASIQTEWFYIGRETA